MIRPPPLVLDEVLAALDLARLLVKAGWVKGESVALVDGQVCYCIDGAITAASRTTRIRDAARAAVHLAVPTVFAEEPLYVFNDHPNTCVGDVVWVLTAAKTMVWKAVST